MWRTKHGRAPVLRPRWRRGVRGGSVRTRGRDLDLERASPYHLDSVGENRRLEELHAPPRPDDLRVQLERSDGNRPHELVGHAGHAKTVRGGELFELPHEQRGGRAAVERPRIPWPAAELGRDETAIRALEH